MEHSNTEAALPDSERNLLVQVGTIDGVRVPSLPHYTHPTFAEFFDNFDSALALRPVIGDT
jgi:hypothetical protein